MVSRGAVLDKARSWLGMTERTGNNDIWFAEDWGISGYAWCFAFVQSCFYYADPSPSGKLPYLTMYVPAGVIYARDNGQAIEVGQGTPLPGDIVFFSWNMTTWGRWTPGTGHHVELLESYDGGNWVNTIGGNVGDPDGVYRFTRPLDEVICFWRPPVFDGGPLTISQPEDDMFDETIDRAALQQTAAAAQSLVAAVAVVDNLLRDTFNNAAGANGGIAGITPTVQDGYNHAVWTWEKLKDVDFAAVGPVPDSPPAADQSGRLESLERRFTAIEQAIARLAGPRPPVASPTAPTSGPT